MEERRITKERMEEGNVKLPLCLTKHYAKNISVADVWFYNS
jgi:hypothetical protein